MLALRLTFVPILFLMILTSCSQLKVSSTPGSTPMFLGLKDEHGTPVELIVNKEYYLWGLIPHQHNVLLDEEFQELGAVGVARISYELNQTWSQWFLGVLSFGVYWPLQLKVHGLAKMGDESSWKYSEGRWR